MSNGRHVGQAATCRVWKFLLELRYGEQVIEMPHGATIVHVHDQVIGGRPLVDAWDEPVPHQVEAGA